ncbi:MAG: ATP-binding protein [Planctomycetota bacterium]
MTQEERDDRRLAFLGRLAGGLAHEIRNPLSTIAMNLQLLQEDWADPETDRERRTVRKLEVLAKEVKRLESILGDFLRYAGRDKLEKLPTRLNDVVEEVLEFMGPKFAEGGVELRFFVGEQLPKILVDRDAVKQVLMNLVLNAIQAMPDGGELMVRTALDAAGAVVLEVTDTGEGIPEELLEKIWDVYYSRRKTGTGMGLPTARRIVEEHDGDMTVVSEHGKGTRFTIRIPVFAGLLDEGEEA